MSATLYLVRHGIAEERAGSGRDADRRLTAEGIRKMHEVAAGLERLGVRPDAVLSSPLRRARETAAVLVEVLAPDLAVEIYAPLAPPCDPVEVLAGLGKHRGARHIVLVGHQPDLGELASQLLTGSPATAPLPFKKGSVAAIAIGAVPPRANGVLQWAMTPKQLRAVAEADE